MIDARPTMADLPAFDEIERSFATCQEVLRRWRLCVGQDTKFIARATGIPEADVCRIVAADQDRRYELKRRGSRHG